MEKDLVRVAALQLDYHPALFSNFRSCIEDPGGLSPLLPASADLPPKARANVEKLRARVREAYCRQLLARLDVVLNACRHWKVRVVVLPEYSVPIDILEPLAYVARQAVVVAGTHRVEPAGLRSGVYQRLGWPEERSPRPGQAVAPVLHDGKILALVPKLHAAEAVREEIDPGDQWEPVPMPDGVPGPMGVLICLDFLHRESDRYRRLVADKLAACRFLAVPSFTSPHSIPEFQAKAWEEAKRYGRPVIYSDHSSGGGTAFFVDEEKHSDLLPYPSKPGCLRPNEEGILVADIDLGYERAGGSTRYSKTRPVKPQGAPTLVYSAYPLESAYTAWIKEFYDLLEVDGDRGLNAALAHMDKHRPLLEKVRTAASPTRRERLALLLDNTRFIATRDELGLLACDLHLQPGILPMSVLRAAHIKGAEEAAVRWLGKIPALGPHVAALLKEASEARPPDLVKEAHEAVEKEKTCARGGVLGERSPLDYVGPPMASTNGVSITIRRHARDFEMKMTPKRAAAFLGALASPIDHDLPRSRHTPQEDNFDLTTSQIPIGYAQATEAFSDILEAEGAEPVAAVAVSPLLWMSYSGMLFHRAPGITFGNGRIFLFHRAENQWRLTTYEVPERAGGPDSEADEAQEPKPFLDEQSRKALIHAFEEWGIEVAGIDVVPSAEIDRRFKAVFARFKGGRETAQEFRRRRLSDVADRFVEPSLSYERVVADGWERRVKPVVEPALEALSSWLRAKSDERTDVPLAAIVLGEYGSGKSTLLAEWSCRLWEEPDGPWPLLVDLAGSSAKDPEALLLAAARLEDNRANRAALRLAVRSRKIIPIFDGFDEMATRVSAAELPQRLTDLFDAAYQIGRVVLSSRDHYFPTEGELKRALDGALRVSLRGPHRERRLSMCFFSEDQIRSLILKVVGDERSAGELWRRIQQTYDLEELCKRPILLAMLIATRDDLTGAPNVRRVDLYEACLRRWLTHAGVAEPEIFTTEEKRRLAETIAVEVWRTGEPDVPLDTLRDLLHTSFRPGFFDDLPRTAELLETTGGMFLVRNATDTGDRYRFAHKSFLEYFLASAIVQAVESGPREIPRVLSVRPLTGEVIDFVGEILEGERGEPEAAFVSNLRRWLVGRSSAYRDKQAETADATANTVRLLLGLARARGDKAGWLPEKADLRAVCLVKEDLREVKLTSARLTKANLCGADLSGADLAGADLQSALLRGARLDRAILRGANAEGADFTMAEAAGATLEGASLDEAILRQSMWVSCCFWGTSLKDADTLAWMTPGAVGLPTGAPVPFRQVELAVNKDDVGAVQNVYSGAFSEGGSRISAATWIGDIHEWDAHTHRGIARLSTRASSSNGPMVRWASSADVVVGLQPGRAVNAWSERDLRIIHRIEGHYQDVCVAPDGALVAVAGWDEPVRILRLASGEEVARLDAFQADVLDMVFSPDGRSLGLALSGGLGVLWSFMQGNARTFHLAPEGAEVSSIAFHPEDDLLACSAGDFFLRLVGISAGRPPHNILTTQREFRGLRFSPSGAYLSGIAADGSVRVWDVEERREISRIDAGFAPSWRQGSLAWSPDERAIATFHGTIALFSPTTGLRVSRVEQRAMGTIDFVRWSSLSDRLLCQGRQINGALLVERSPGRVTRLSISEDSRVAGWSAGDEVIAVRAGSIERRTPGGELLGPELTLKPEPAHPPFILRGGERIVAVARTSGGRLSLWNATTGDLLASLPWGLPDNPLRMELCHTGRLLAVSHARGLHVLLVESEGTAIFTDEDMKNPWLWGFRPGDEAVLFVRRDDSLWLWIPGEEPRPQSLTLPGAFTLEWHPSAASFAVGHDDGSISLIDAETLETEAALTGHACRVRLLAWSRDGSRLASVDEGGELRLWDGSQRRLLLTVTAAGDAALARTPGGYCNFIGGTEHDYRLVATADPDSAARLYVPLGGLRGVLHRPQKVAAALEGDLSADDAEIELSCLSSLFEW